MVKKSIICLYLLSFLSALPVYAKRPPGLDWREWETKHFVIIYPEKAAPAAARLASIAENVYPEVRGLFGYAPPGRTPVVLNTERDYANGYAQSIFRKLEFYLAVPDDLSFGPEDPAWLESLMLHEYAHLCHGMREEGFSGWLTAVFGGVHGLNFVAPRWWVEGVAVYSETQLSTGGRGKNPYQRMKLAANILSAQPWSLAQIGHHPAFSYPADRIYLAGYDMLEYLHKKTNRRGLLDALSREQSAWPFFGLGNVWKKVAGYDPEFVWEQVQTELGQDFMKRYGAERMPLPDAVVIADDPESTYFQPQWTMDDRLLVFRQSLQKESGLVKINLRSGREEVFSQPDMFWGRWQYLDHEDVCYGARLITHALYTDTRSADLFVVSRRGEKRLTQQQHCWSPAYHPETGRLVCVEGHWDTARLRFFHPASGSWRAIPAPAGAVYASPRWSFDGRWLAAAVCIRGKQDICLVDWETGKLTPLTGWDTAGDFNPVWSRDGKYILFVSDRGGTHQIYAYEMETRLLYRVTDARLGAFDPAVSPENGRIAFVEYCPGNRQQVVIAPFAKDGWVLTPFPASGQQPESDTRFQLPPVKGRAYSAWPYLLPSLWLPMAGWDQDGLLIGMASAQQDPLESHMWQGRLLFQPQNGKAYGDFSYTNAEGFLMKTVRAFSLPQVRWGRPGHYADTQAYWFREQGVQVSARVPWLLRQAHDAITVLQAEAAYEAMQLLDAPPGILPGSFYTGVQGGIRLSAVKQRPKDLFPIQGFALLGESRAALPGHSYDGRLAFAEADVHLPVPWLDHALMLSARGVVKAGIFPRVSAAAPPKGYYGGQFNRGHNLTLAAAYRLPLWYIDEGAGLWPIFFHDVWAEGVSEWGAGWDGNITLPDWQQQAVYSLGAILHLDMELFWYLSSRLDAGLIYKPAENEIVLKMDINLGF
ncbi:PD40 domain-containing protein [candidate division FCPU426 bacterium]|nr:PD40 domain-containing protein [candidate division FCPU426 bacterium]